MKETPLPCHRGIEQRDYPMRGFGACASAVVIAASQIKPGLSVLDIGSGSGEPALSVVPLVAPDGQVIASDLAPEMLVTAEEEAARLGLTTLTGQQADAEDLPFPDASFDLATSRFSIMYCPDAPRAFSWEV